MLFCLERNGDLKAPPRCGFLMDSRGSPKEALRSSLVSAPKRLGGRPFWGRWFWGQQVTIKAGQGTRKKPDPPSALLAQWCHSIRCFGSGGSSAFRGVMKTDGDNAILLEDFFQRYVPSTNFPFFFGFKNN